jgi:hypothetical protein
MKTARLVPLLLFAALALASLPAGAAELAVDLKNDASRSISVPVGTDNGVTAESDFEVVAGTEQTVPVFPGELFRDRFWSAPLSAEDYALIAKGAPVRPFKADKTTHKLMRRIAAEYGKQLEQEKASAKRWEQRKQQADLADRRTHLQEQKERLDARIAEAGRGIADGQDRARWKDDSADQDIVRAEQRIADLTDQRNELQSQRDALPRQDRTGIARLSEQVRLLNVRIASERDVIRRAQERKLDSKSAIQRDYRDRRTLQAESDALAVEIKALDRQIEALRKATE